MTAAVKPPTADSADDQLLADLIEEYAARAQAGEPVDLEAFVQAHPNQADRLRRLLPGVRVLVELEESLGADAAAGADPETAARPGGNPLGDFRLVREVGRGGMGVVYEAEQLSLSRRVALKVLPLAGTLDERHLRRFKNEALAAVHLDHPNIVDVLGVGSERGVHYYAMRFIEGSTLADVIRDLRAERDRGNGAAVAGRGKCSAADAAAPDATQAYVPPPAPSSSPADAPTQPQAALSTKGSVRGAAFFRSMAQVGAQVAEALDYAHQQGIIHRDVKPSNLLLDGRGKPWVTDFGLAQMHSDVKLTQTGDLVGTLRYMSPEQALAKRVVIDHRSDVYSLGATLYELLTLEPPFAGQDRQELLRQVAFEEPRRPRTLNRAIPTELETIVLKAMEKNPADRYATAQELADDLRRFLEDRPIRARRPSLVQRGRKWARRHRTLVGAVAAVLLLIVLLGSGSGLWWLHKRSAAEGVARALLKEATRLQQEEKWTEGISAIEHAKGVLAGVGADPDLWRQVEELGKDLEMVRRLEEARLRETTVKDGHFDTEEAVAAYAEAFQWYGLDVARLDPREAGKRIRSRSIRCQLAAALDYWAALYSKFGITGSKHLLDITRVADPDPWRGQLRDALERKDAEALNKLVGSDPNEELSSATLPFLSDLASRPPTAKRMIVLLRKAQQRHPGDFWINHQLAQCFSKSRPPQLEEAIRYYTAAVALRPQSPGAHLNFGNALKRKGQLDEAIGEYREAIQIKKDYAEAHCGLGSALKDKGQLDEAIAEYREAIRIKKDHAPAHCGLGLALKDKGQLDEAIAAFREAIQMKRDYAEAHNNLGIALKDKGQLDEAIAVFREAIQIKKDYVEAHNNLGSALMRKGQLDEAIAEYREAIRLKKDYALAHSNLGIALHDKGQLDEAIAEYQEAICLDKDFAGPHCKLAYALRDKGQFAEALSAIRRGHELGSKNPRWPYPSAQWVKQFEQLVELDAKLPRVLKGEVQPRDVGERLALAQMCQQPCKSLYAAAARFYSEAFGAQPQLADDLQAQHRYNAAYAAALAGCGQGQDAAGLNEKERGRLRRQALDWLQADLAARRGQLKSWWPGVADQNRQALRHWLADTDFAGVRGPEALARLPETERQAWQKLWAEVAKTLAEAREGKNASPKVPRPEGKK